jgi:hypothetical protein
MLQMSATGTRCSALSLGSLTPSSSSGPIVIAATYDTDNEVKLVLATYRKSYNITFFHHFFRFYIQTYATVMAVLANYSLT